MPRIDLDPAALRASTGYPAPFDEAVAGRLHQRLAPVVGLTAMGLSHVLLRPGAWSSQRHWHEGEDEVLVMLSGEAVLIEDDGETVLRPGDCAAWPAGSRNGHHLVNRSDADCTFLCMSAGDRAAGGGYSDIDMIFTEQGFLHRDGTPYPARRIA
ncbi:MAG TPA: cupin domain-containing protein [Sphingobium sp.]|nr:cupin domain-containing protein [Sphingobium sp.]